MRLVISNSMMTWGGGENWSLTAAAGLAGRGHDVVLVCRPGSALQERAMALDAGFAVSALPVRGDLNPVAVARGLALFRRHDTQLVCCNLDREVRTLGLAARIRGGMTFIRRRGSDYGFKNSLRYRISYRWLVDRIIVNSEATRRSILTRNTWLDPSKLHRIYNGIDTRHFCPDPGSGSAARESLGLPEETPVVGIVGSLLPRKRHAVLFRAARILLDKFPDLRILVIGPAPALHHRTELEREAAILGIGDSVIFMGPVSDAAPWYRAMDVLAMPSENEGFGYAAAEAMACGTPVVVSDASSLPEVVGEDQEGGLIAPLDDHEALAARLRELLFSRGAREHFGSAARARVLREFSIERMTDDVESFFESLTGGEGGRP
jgi:glycosyltransferase involved in cell wall biosynthesis